MTWHADVVQVDLLDAVERRVAVVVGGTVHAASARCRAEVVEGLATGAMPYHVTAEHVLDDCPFLGSPILSLAGPEVLR